MLFGFCVVFGVVNPSVLLAQPSSPPNVSTIPDQGVYPNATSRPIPFVIGDVETPANSLTVAGFSSDTNLIPNARLVFGGSGTNRILTITPASNVTGTVTIAVTVTDAGGGVASNSFAFAIAYFTPMASGLPAMIYGRSAWGDYDNDGYPDVVLSGYAASGTPVARVYHNNGNGTFTDINAGLDCASVGKTAWGDFNRDGYLDLVVTDNTNHVYRNNGDGTFSLVSSNVPGSGYNEPAWGDFDGDGDLDLMIGGTGLFRNNGDETFSSAGSSLPPAYYGSTEWGDFDNDGDLDLVLAGQAKGYLTKVFRNDGNGVFTEVTALLGVYLSASHWGDYDNDGDLDLLVTGGNGDVNRTARIYRNDGGQTFTDINAGLTGVTLSSAAWADFDNDGYLDAIITGMSSNSASFTGLYRNNHNQTFTLVSAGLTNVQYGSVSWADVDNDGDLDLLLAGFASANSTPVIQLYRNNAPSNAPPAAPTAVGATFLPDGEIALSWSVPTDMQTPGGGLTYNLRVGTTPGGGDVFGPQANTATGLRRLPQFTGMHTNRWRFLDLPKGTYYWAVQAIDTAFAGSPFSSEQSLTITNTAPKVEVVKEVHMGPSMTTTLPFTVADAESAAAQLTVTAQSVNATFIPSASVAVQGAGAERTLSFRVGAGQMGTNYVVLRVSDPGGLFSEVSVRVVSELFTSLPIAESTNFYSLSALRIGWGYPYASPVVDVDRDGDLDVLMQGTILSNYNVMPVFVIAFNDGLGNFTLNIVSNLSQAITGSSYWFDDFDRDGNVDLLSVSDSYDNGTVQVLAGDGRGGFAPGRRVGPNGISMFADVDNDGDLDGLALPSDASCLKYYENVGGLFRARPGPPLISFNTSQETEAARATDIDGDGDVDFFIPGQGTNSSQRLVMRILRNSGRGQFTSELFPILGSASLYGIWTYDGDDDGDCRSCAGPPAAGLSAHARARQPGAHAAESVAASGKNRLFNPMTAS